MHREERQGSEGHISFAECKAIKIIQFFTKQTQSNFQIDSQISVTAAHRHIHLLSPNRWKAVNIKFTGVGISKYRRHSSLARWGLSFRKISLRS
jgi:hypothetical protein